MCKDNFKAPLPFPATLQLSLLTLSTDTALENLLSSFRVESWAKTKVKLGRCQLDVAGSVTFFVLD